MLFQESKSEDVRETRLERQERDLIVAGGGLAGLCAAVMAARQGLRVTLAQDRPVLGGNASSEVRLWALGATSHMYNNNRWAREGGVLDELLLENVYRNREGNPVLVDSVLLDWAVSEPNLTLLLNTCVRAVRKSAPDRIEAVEAFCSQNSTRYELVAPWFVDATGDGIVAFQAGAAFRMGAESREEFGEAFAPPESYGELLGDSIYFYTRDAGKPVTFRPPSFAYKDGVEAMLRSRKFDLRQQGCQLWWIAYGGTLDTVHDSKRIKWKLWELVYGIWDYVKNSGKYPEADNLTLEWVGMIPGKRESRRFEGDVMLTQGDLVGARAWPDAVAHGGWALDLHPSEGVFYEGAPCTHWQNKGIYAIPYRSLYRRDIGTLYLGGRSLSVSHAAFGSVRVMCTLAACGQAIGMAAALCAERGCGPRAVSEGAPLDELRLRLARAGQHIPGYRREDPEDLAQTADISASSEYALGGMPADGPWFALERGAGQMLPLKAGPVPALTFWAATEEPTALTVELRVCSRPEQHTPDVSLERRELRLEPGEETPVELHFGAELEREQYAFVLFHANPAVRLRQSERRVTGVLSVFFRKQQKDCERYGVDPLELWTPRPRPGGQNFALALNEPPRPYAPANVADGKDRPTNAPHAWVADPEDPAPAVELTWEAPRTVGAVTLAFDCDWDHPLQTVIVGHPADRMPFCVSAVRVVGEAGEELGRLDENHHSRRTLRFAEPVETRKLRIECGPTHGGCPAALYEVLCFAR